MVGASCVVFTALCIAAIDLEIYCEIGSPISGVFAVRYRFANWAFEYDRWRVDGELVASTTRWI